MKLKSLFLFALAALLTVAVPRPARALEISFEFFHDSLSPYGEWIELGDYGYCWRPTGVDEEWTPYSDGYWTYTDAGWTWVSYEEFGGIVYHYGRWTKVEDEGWCWVPDYEWGPAWVSWRKSDDYVGWAPLPAEARWERERGFSVWVDSSYDIAPANYSFCRFHDFGAPVLRPVIIRRSENIVIINHTVNITNITYNAGASCVFNGGLEYGYVNRFSRRQVPALKLVRNTNLTVVNNHIVNNNVRVTNFNSVQQGNQLTVIAPTVIRPPREKVAALLQPKVTKVIAKEKVTKGWGSVPSAERAAIRAKFQQEVAGKTPETAPAIPLKTADLKVVPIKADPKAKLPLTARKVPIVAPTPDPDGGKKKPDVVPGTPTATPPATVTLPPTATDPAKSAREKSRKPGKITTPPPSVARELPQNPPAEKVIAATPPPVVKDRTPPARPGIVKPFKSLEDDNKPGKITRSVATPPPANAVIDKRDAAADAAKKQAAVQEDARRRAMEQNDQRQEIARRNNAQEAAVAQKRMLQQQQQQQDLKQKQPEPPVARKRPVEPPQIQQMQNQQQQQLLRDRAEQAAESKQRSLQTQAPARQKAPPVQVQPPRNVAPQVQPRNLPPAVQPQKVPGKPGKRPLTPEEAAQLQQQQQLR